jgi:DNA-binding response OmpR family regulator
MTLIEVKPHILICDDNDDVLEFLAKSLSIAGYETATAHGHDEFLKAYDARAPDLILLDVRMPERDGFWIAERLQMANNKAPIIFITAHDRPLYRLCAPIAGAVDYVTKPFDPDDLERRIKSALQTDAKTSNWFLQSVDYEKRLNSRASGA